MFAVLLDPETYPGWLYGARHIRAVDDDWPAPGTQFHHRVGPVLPFTIADSTEVVEVDRPCRLVMEVRFRPLGRGVVTFETRPAEGDASRTVVTVTEKPIGRLGLLAPVLAAPFAARNHLSLRALERYLDRRQPVKNRSR